MQNKIEKKFTYKLCYFKLAGFFLSFIAICTVSSSNCQAQIQETVEALKKLENKVQFTTLSNGIRVIIYPRPIAPIFSGVVAAHVGGTDEQLGQSGIAHMLEHMAFKGTPQVGTSNYNEEKDLLAKLEVLAEKGKITQSDPSLSDEWKSTMEKLRKLWVTDQFTREYEKRGASGMNAYTTSEITAYFVNLPRNVFEFWCYMESERIAEPVMRQFYEERDVVMEERRMRYETDPEGKLYELLLSSVFRAHPYGKPVIGYDFDIKRLTASDIEKFHKKFYVPSQLVVSIAGDVQLDKDLPVLEKYFGRIKTGPTPERPHAVEPPQTGQREVVLNERGSPLTMIAYHKPVYPDPEDAIISVMAEIFAGSNLSPLYKNLVEQQRIAVSVGSSEAPGNAYPNALIFQLTPRTPNDNAAVIEAFDKTLKQFQDSWKDEELLEFAKRSVAMNYLGTLKSSQGLALALASDELLHNNWKASMEWFDSAMKVTAEQVRNAAKKYLSADNRTIARLESKEIK